MNKYAAEKIAEEYYALGFQLALEKTASSILNPHLAERLAATLGQQIGRAGKLTSEAGVLRKLTGHIPGTQMSEAQKILRGASGKANQGFAETAHNLGYGLGPIRPAKLPGAFESIPKQRYTKAVEQGMIPRGHTMHFPKNVQEALGYDKTRLQTKLMKLPEQLKSMPSEAELLSSMGMRPLRKGYYG